ncbi:unnamed protein product [Spirodela intermedia]|uniref:Uncharacterized protein n=1 Tax=Spirodela intermedia TaxID=51605 RepID=A0A7I8K996_SPIIN|nr:unnamed protein product [Spirodela intermedia]
MDDDPMEQCPSPPLL